jgi:hypothetical protein
MEVNGGIEKKLPDGTWETPPDTDSLKQCIEIVDMRILVLSLKYEEDTYRKMGRIEQANQIKDWLE